MSIELRMDHAEVERILTGYSTATIGVHVNKLSVDETGAFVLSYDPLLNGKPKRRSVWAWFKAWRA